MIHFPVTTAFWRGVFYRPNYMSTLRRACDWKPADHKEPHIGYSFDLPECLDCLHYKNTLIRLGVLK